MPIAKTMQNQPGSGILLTPRQRFLADLNNQKIRAVRIPRDEIRAAADKMVSFKPLVDTTDVEKKIIVHFAIEGMEQYWSEMIDNLDKLRSGEWKMRSPATGKLAKATQKQIVPIFIDWEGSKTKAFCTCPGNECKKSPGNTMVNRALTDIFLDTKMDIVSAAEDVSRGNTNRIIALDVGCADGAALFELGKKMDGKLETHGISILDETRAPVDYFYHISAEFMPAGFRGKFNLEYTHRTLEYTALPHLVLANMALGLASKGKALVQWADAEFEIMYKTNVRASGIYDYFDKYLREMISGTTAKAIRNGRLVEGELLLNGGDYDRKNQVRRALEYRDLEKKQALTYCAELSLINAMPEFRLTIGKKEDTHIGMLPALATIERV